MGGTDGVGDVVYPLSVEAPVGGSGLSSARMLVVAETLPPPPPPCMTAGSSNVIWSPPPPSCLGFNALMHMSCTLPPTTHPSHPPATPAL